MSSTTSEHAANITELDFAAGPRMVVAASLPPLLRDILSPGGGLPNWHPEAQEVKVAPDVLPFQVESLVATTLNATVEYL